MEDPIKKYVASARRNGFSDKQIRTTLIAVGWEVAKIDAVIASMPGGIEYDEAAVRNSLKQWINGLYRGQLAKLGVITAILIGLTALALLEPWPLKIIVDSAFGRISPPDIFDQYFRSTTLLYIMAGFLIIIAFLSGLTQLIYTRFFNSIKFSFDKKIKADFFAHVLRLPLTYRKKLQSGDYVYRQNAQTSELTDIIIDIPARAIEALLMLIGVLLISFAINPVSALIMLGSLPIYILAVRYFGPLIAERSKVTRETNTDTDNLATDSIKNMQLIQSYNRETAQVGKLVGILEIGFRRMLGIEYIKVGFQGAIGIITSLLMVLVLVAGGRDVSQNNLYLGELLVLLAYTTRIYRPIEMLSGAYDNYRQSYQVIGRVFEVLNEHAEVDEEENTGYRINDLSAEIIFDEVSLYAGEDIILKDISLRIGKGEKVGFIGPSGSGKSTLLNTLLKFTDYKGSITLDGIELREINKRSLRSVISMVSQSPELFSDTIINNITYSLDMTATPEQIITATRSAQAHDFIMQLPQQYYTKVSEAEEFLDDGQLQRIAIARAFLRDSSLLILDEPTAALDVQTEKEVVRSIFELMKSKTVILVASKLSLLTQMDKVYVVEGGTVVDVSSYGGVDRYHTYLRTHELI